MIVDLHSHTSAYSECGRDSLTAMVRAAMDRGLDALCVTEHDVVYPEERAEMCIRDRYRTSYWVSRLGSGNLPTSLPRSVPVAQWATGEGKPRVGPTPHPFSFPFTCHPP